MASILEDLPDQEDVLRTRTDDLANRVLLELSGNSLNRGNDLARINRYYNNDPHVEEKFLAAWAHLVLNGYLVEKAEPGFFFLSERGKQIKENLAEEGLKPSAVSRTFGDRWTMDCELSSGGQGITYLVRDEHASPKDRFVLKELRNAADEQSRRRFVHETTALAQLDHPNILRVVDSDLQVTHPWYVSEYCAGGGLDKADISQFDLSKRTAIFLDVCRALAAAHDHNITHRDIKPENILLRSPGGPAVLADFGICWLREGDDERLTRAHEDIGSSFCRAPELFDGPSDVVTPSSDVYCLGKLLYWLMVGKGGRDGRLRTEDFQSTAKNLVAIHHDSIYEHVNELLRKMIVEDPATRFENARAVYDAAVKSFELIEHRYQPINAAPKRCEYCGQGAYAKHPADSGTSTELSILQVWNAYICSTCGNTLFFRKNGRNNRW